MIVIKGEKKKVSGVTVIEEKSVTDINSRHRHNTFSVTILMRRKKSELMENLEEENVEKK
jgi:hypothetical protein